MMDSSPHKLYHVHGYDSRQHLEHYFSDKPDMVFGDDTLKFVIDNHRQVFAVGHINGDILIDLSLGSFVHHLHSACEFFKNIIVLKVNNRCIMELKRWVDERTGAFYWGHTSTLLQETEENSDQFQDQEAKLRSAIQHVVKYDLEKENMTDPLVLPPADCVISAFLLDVISKDQDDYIRYLRKFSRLLKPGGHLIIIGVLGATYFTVGKDKFHGFTCDEDFIRKAVVGEGFIIDYCNVKERTAVSDLTDYKSIIFIAAHKESRHVITSSVKLKKKI